MARKRPTVSMTLEIYRWLRWASEITGRSMCQIMADALTEHLQRAEINRPHPNWEPTPRPGRRRRHRPGPPEAMSGGVHFI